VPRISVVIAAYNHAPYVRACIESVLTQSFQDFEIIVVDDGSRDGTPDAVRAIADPRVELTVFERNRGACVALNTAIERSRGDYIAVLNSDDLFLPGKLAKQLAFLEANPQIAAVFGHPVLVNEQGQPFTDGTHKDAEVFFVENRGRHDWLRQFFYNLNCLCHPTVLIRRQIYKTVGLYDPAMAQLPDLDMWVRIAMRFDIHVMAEPLIQFRIRDNLSNASAARPEVLIRHAWEQGLILRHYRKLAGNDFAAVFQEPAPVDPLRRLAQLACGVERPAYRSFGLALWHQTLDPHGADEYMDYIRATGQYDVFRTV
jgi:glycosyltransferase involved in cell wall biosynthesis